MALYERHRNQIWGVRHFGGDIFTHTQMCQSQLKILVQTVPRQDDSNKLTLSAIVLYYCMYCIGITYYSGKVSTANNNLPIYI